MARLENDIAIARVSEWRRVHIRQSWSISRAKTTKLKIRELFEYDVCTLRCDWFVRPHRLENSVSKLAFQCLRSLYRWDELKCIVRD